MTLVISSSISNDVDEIKNIIDSTELFPSEMLDDMMDGYLNNEAPHEIWLTASQDGKPVAAAFCSPEQMAEGTYNLYMIAVHKKFQNTGIGSQLMAFIEQKLTSENIRVLIVETADTNQYELTREFYDKLNYTRAGHIPQFYSPEEGKVIFYKNL